MLKTPRRNSLFFKNKGADEAPLFLRDGLVVERILLEWIGCLTGGAIKDAALFDHVGAAIGGWVTFYHQVIVDFGDAFGGAQQVEDVGAFIRGGSTPNHVNVAVDGGDEIVERVDAARADEARLDLSGDPCIPCFLASAVGGADEEFIINFANTLGAVDHADDAVAIGLCGDNAGNQYVVIEDVNADIGEVMEVGFGEVILDADFEAAIDSDLGAGAILQADITRRGTRAEQQRCGTTRKQD